MDEGDDHGPATRDVDGFPAWLLTRVGHGVQQRLAAAIARHGLTPRQFGALSLIDAYDDLSPADLARAVLIRPQSVATLLDSLVDRDLVARVGGGGRGRRARLELRPAGARLLTASWSAIVGGDDAVDLGLSAAEQDTLVALLQKVSATLGEPGTVRSRP